MYPHILILPIHQPTPPTKTMTKIIMITMTIRKIMVLTMIEMMMTL